ncbi:MAG: hypothetical protein Q8Q20_04135 [bacterium]|nr:hypothetical protein [bacterium]
MSSLSLNYGALILQSWHGKTVANTSKKDIPINETMRFEKSTIFCYDLGAKA